MSTPTHPTNFDLLLAMARLEGKVDTLVATDADHEARVRVLESQRWPARSVAMLVSVGALLVSGLTLITR